uniref:Uncharacterized protein n=1 Tax=Sphaerodactylus townsendi TaxID=933632 RepID=A0ACB8FBL8_9SAUR
MDLYLMIFIERCGSALLGCCSPKVGLRIAMPFFKLWHESHWNETAGREADGDLARFWRLAEECAWQLGEQDIWLGFFASRVQPAVYSCPCFEGVAFVESGPFSSFLQLPLKLEAKSISTFAKRESQMVTAVWPLCPIGCYSM